MNKNKGFTLIKGLVCFAILSILFAIVLGGISGCSVSDGLELVQYQNLLIKDYLINLGKEN